MNAVCDRAFEDLWRTYYLNTNQFKALKAKRESKVFKSCIFYNTKKKQAKQNKIKRKKFLNKLCWCVRKYSESSFLNNVCLHII